MTQATGTFPEKKSVCPVFRESELVRALKKKSKTQMEVTGAVLEGGELMWSEARGTSQCLGHEKGVKSRVFTAHRKNVRV